MTGARNSSKPSFLWRGAAILGPVLLLVGAGLWMLWRDRAAMEGEVRGRIDPIASTMLTEIKTWLHPIRGSFGKKGPIISISGTAPWFELRSDNSLEQSWPETWPPTPAPFPTNLVDRLTSNEADLWSRAVEAERDARWKEAVELYSAFAKNDHVLRPGPYDGLSDERLRGEAFSRIAAAYLRLGETNLAIQAFDAVSHCFTPGSDTRSEAGLPMTHLAAVQLFRLTSDPAELLRSWNTNSMQFLSLLANDHSPFGRDLALRFQEWYQPAPADLTLPPNMKDQPEVLKKTWRENEAAIFRIAEREEVKDWLRTQEAWRLYHEAAGSFGSKDAAWPKLFWVEGDYRWLAVEQPSSPADSRRRIFAAFPRAAVEAEMSRIAQQEDSAALFAVSLKLAGTEFLARQQGTTDWNNPAISRTLEALEEELSVTVTLADPGAYFEAQRRRQLWLCGLMLASATACLAAFFSAWRAFRQQLQLNDQKSNFVSSVSHELRAPIASVRLMAESLQRGKIEGPQKQHEYFKFIVQECRRLSSLIENVLDFSRIEQGRKQYELEPTDLLALTRETVKLMEPYAAEKGVQLELKSETENLEFEVDGRAIQQALVNLIDNAVKHSDKAQTVTVAIALASGGASESIARITVMDSGPGIPPAEREKIFERFYRLGSELRRETQGVGIGLSIVKHIVEAHGGRVWVESTLGKGSQFIVDLPSSRPE